MRKQHPFVFQGLGNVPQTAQVVPRTRSRGEILGLPASDFFKILAPTAAALGSGATLIAYAAGSPRTGAILGVGTAVGTAFLVFVTEYSSARRAYDGSLVG
jgi:hypothetical protein